MTFDGSDWQEAIDKWNTLTLPEGYTLVPIEPTEEMIEAAAEKHSCGYMPETNSANIYKAMLKAAGGE